MTICCSVTLAGAVAAALLVQPIKAKRADRAREREAAAEPVGV